jgi:tetratricopeptide (TPR) repeat protein
MRITTLAIAALVGVCVPAAASAQDNTAFAQQRFTRGTSLYEARDFPHALEEFRASIELYGSPNTRLYLARCLRELGRLDEAVPEFERAMREAGDRARLDPRYVQTRDAAQAELLQVEPRVGRLTLTIPDAPPGASVRVNQRPVPVAALGIAIPVMPGPVTITIEAAGFEPEERHTEVAAGREATVGVVLRRRAAAEGYTEVGALARPTVPTRPTPPPSRGPRRSLGLIGVGVGAAGFISFAAFYALASGRFDDIGARCGAGGCATVTQSEIDEGRTFQLLTNISLGVGLAGAAAAVTLFAIGRSSEPPPVTVSVGPRSIGVGGSF